MSAPSLQLMFTLWATKGAKLAHERVNGHDRNQTLIREKRHLVENFNEVESESQDEHA